MPRKEQKVGRDNWEVEDRGSLVLQECGVIFCYSALMGVAFVFLIYVVAVAVVSVPLMALAAWIGNRIARRSSAHTKKVFRLGGMLLPPVAGVYLLGCLVVMAMFGEFTGRDSGFGDDFELPLRNGYQWTAIDEPAAACVYRGSSADIGYYCKLPNTNRDVFVDVLALQQHEDWLAGAFDGDVSHFLNPEKQQSDHWFLFNSKTQERFDAQNEAALARLTAQHGFVLKLDSSSDFYSQHRYRWTDALVVFLLIAPAIAVTFWLRRKARKLLQKDAEAAGPGDFATT